MAIQYSPQKLKIAAQNQDSPLLKIKIMIYFENSSLVFSSAT
jgi:hypothetical protein